MKWIYSLVLFAALAAGQSKPEAYANVFTIRDLPPAMSLFCPKDCPDYIQAFVLHEPVGAQLRIEVAYEYAGDVFQHSDTQLAGEYAAVVTVNVPDGRKAKPLAVRVNGAILWGAWPTVMVPRIRHREPR